MQEQCQEKHAPDIDPRWYPVFRPTLRENRPRAEAANR